MRAGFSRIRGRAEIGSRRRRGADTTYPGSGINDAIGNLTRVRVEGTQGGATPSGNDRSGNVLLSETRYELDEMYRVTAVVEEVFVGTGAPQAPAVSQTDYDALGRAVRTVEPDGEEHTTLYDGLSRVVERVHPLGNLERFTYDANGNLLTQVEVEGNTTGGSRTFVTTMQFDALNRAVRRIDNAGQVTDMTYDSRDNVVRAVDDEGNVLRVAFDMLNRRVEELHELRVGGVGAGALDTSNTFNADGLVRMSYEWDDNSRLVGFVDDSGNRTAYGYDSLNRKTLAVMADLRRTEWIYNVDDTVKSQTDPNGSVVTWTYDSVDRPVQVDVVRGAGVVGTTRETFEFDGLGRITACVDDNGLPLADHVRVEAEFDSLSRLVTERQNGREIRSSWSVDSKRLECVLPGGRTLAWSYDGIDHVRSVSDASGVVASWDYEGGGSRVVRAASRNGTTSVWEHDAVRRVAEVRHEREGAAFVERAYTYNGANRRTSETRLDDFGQRDEYRFDSLYRVVRTDLDQGGSGGDARGVASIEYALDGVGNRREVRKDGALEEYAVNARNQYTEVGGGQRRHDANGNLVEAGGLEFAYDYRNRLVSVGVVGAGVKCAFRYDCSGRRVRKQVFDPGTGALVGDVAFLYDGDQVCEERDAADTTLVTYVYGPSYVDDVVELQRSPAAPLGVGELFMHQDARFNVVSVTDGGGEVERRFYDDFGNAFDATKQPVVGSLVGNPYGFQGRRVDAEVGLYYFRARYYDPGTGRFLQEDPVWDPGNLGSAYAFAGNDPLTGLDPSGLYLESAWDLASLTVGISSFVYNVSTGNGWGAALDVVGIVADTVALLLPVVPGGVGIAIRAYRAGDKISDGYKAYKLGGRIDRVVDAIQAVDMAVNVGQGAAESYSQFKQGNSGWGTFYAGMAAMGVTGAAYKGAIAVKGKCFLAGTHVATSEGPRPIEDLRPGDQVLSRDEATGAQGYKRVVRLFRGETNQVVHLRIAKAASVQRGRSQRHRVGQGKGGSSSDGEEGSEPARPGADGEQTIRSTVGHPYFVVGRGWVHAKDLQVGDELSGSKGELLVVTGLEVREEQAKHYNFEVEGFHTYFVSETKNDPAVWVHNTGCGPTRTPGSITPATDIQFTGSGLGRNLVFGQRRIGPRFRSNSEASDLIRGRDIRDVAADLRAGRIHPDELPISYFEQGGQMITLNNRGLAALTLAGKNPTILTRVHSPPQSVLNRLADAPIDQHHLFPGRRLAVTEQVSGAGHLFTVIRPGG